MYIFNKNLLQYVLCKETYIIVICHHLKITFWAGIHKTCWDQILSQVLSFGLKSETIFGLKLVSYSQNSWDQI